MAGHALAVVERDSTSDPSTGRVLTGSWLWDSSLVLAAHLAADSRARRRLLGATVVELGAGSTGLPGVAAVACLGAARCALTDMAALLPGLRANADANGMSAARADVRELRWGDRLQLEDNVFYDPEDMSAMAATLRGMWWTDEDEEGGGGGTVGWAASEVRDSVLDCMGVLREHGFEVAEVDRVTRPLLHHPGQTAAFAVYRVSLRQGNFLNNERGADFG